MLIKSLFWQIINSIVKICLEIFVFDRKIRRILKGNWAKFYLRKYVAKGCKTSITVIARSSGEDWRRSNPQNNMDCHEEQSSSRNDSIPVTNIAEPQIIWQYWESKDGSIPPLVQACLNSVDKFKGDRKRIILNPDNVKDYVNIPEIFWRMREKGLIKTAFFSDILRTCLLIQHGGIWMDATVLLTEELPEYIANSELFVFQNDLKIDLDGLNMASYFIVAKPNNPILVQTLKAMEAYWKENRFLVNYFTFLHAFTMVTQKNK